MENTIVVNGVELEFNIYDLDCAEKYEEAVALVEKEANEYKSSSKKISDVIKSQCQSVFNFFDDVFGEGTSEEVFGERTNLMECLNAFRTVTSAVKKQLEEINPILDEVKNEKLNRQQRRSKRNSK